MKNKFVIATLLAMCVIGFSMSSVSAKVYTYDWNLPETFTLEIGSAGTDKPCVRNFFAYDENHFSTDYRHVFHAYISLAGGTNGIETYTETVARVLQQFVDAGDIQIVSSTTRTVLGEKLHKNHYKVVKGDTISHRVTGDPDNYVLTIEK